MLTLADIGRVLPSERNQRLVKEAMNREVLVVQDDEMLDIALEKLTGHRVGWIPVIEVETTTGTRHVIGRIAALDITHLYRETTVKDARRMRGLVDGTVMVQAIIEPGMLLAGRPLREAKLPQQRLVVSKGSQLYIDSFANILYNSPYYV